MQNSMVKPQFEFKNKIYRISGVRSFLIFYNHSYQVKVYFVDNTVHVVAKVAVCSEFL